MSGPGPVKIPPAVASVLASLSQFDEDAQLVGRAVPALLHARPAHDFEISTSLDCDALLRRLPHAIPLDSDGRRLLLPTPDGSIDLLPRGRGEHWEDALARRDFAHHAMGLDADGRVRDPFGGWDALQQRRLRCVGDPAARFAEDPLRALRALKWLSLEDWTPDPALLDALPDAHAGLRRAPAVALRAELHPLLLGPFVERALGWLHESSLESAFCDGAGADAAAVVARLPARLELRLAGWLRGARVVRTLRRLREPRARVIAVERLLHIHPIDALVVTSERARTRRLVRRSGDALPDLLLLRAAEIDAHGGDASAHEKLESTRRALHAAESDEPPAAPRPLAFDGRAVMEALQLPPGREVGRALAYLAKAVEADPSCNHPDALRARLLAWHGQRDTLPAAKPARSEDT